MKTNNYFYTMSQNLLNIVFKFSKQNKDEFLINIKSSIWPIISTSLLLSENLLKNEDIYKLLTSKQYNMLENLIEKCIDDPDYIHLESYFLDENNKPINSFHNLTFIKEDFKGYLEEAIYHQYKKHGCNHSVITNEQIDYKKLIVRIRNSLAHSTYEIIDDNYLRLYHIDEKTNKLDFNVKINKVIILTVIDELNELALKLYEEFVDEYYSRNKSIQYLTTEVTDKEIIEYLKSFKAFTEDEIEEIIYTAKKDKDFYPEIPDDNNYDKFSLIYDIIYKKIKPTCDFGIIVNEIIASAYKDDKQMDYYFYEKYGYYEYFNSSLYESSNFRNLKLLKEHTFKLILLAYLNCILLFGYNFNQNINYSKINFSNMEIDEKIKNKYIADKYKKIRNSFKCLSQKEKELDAISNSIKKLKKQLTSGKNQNEFLTKVLPERISSLQNIYEKKYQEYEISKIEVQVEMYNKLFEVNDIQDNINLTQNISEFIINHLRNALAHGYIDFPNGIDFADINETIICFEDYEKNTKEQTFKGTIKLINLLNVLTQEEVLNEIFALKHSVTK